MYTVPGYAESPVSWYLPICSERDTESNVSVYLGRQKWGGVPDQKNKLESFSCSSCPKCYGSNVKKNVLLLVQMKNMCTKYALSTGTSPPPLSTLGKYNVIYVIKWTRPFPSVLAYCQ